MTEIDKMHSLKKIQECLRTIQFKNDTLEYWHQKVQDEVDDLIYLCEHYLKAT